MSEKQTIEELVQKAQSGSTKDFGKLYDLLADRIYHYVLRKVGNKQKRLANPKTLCYARG